MTTLPLLIAPSILAADFGHMADAAQLVAKSGGDWLHCDIMDGHFVPNLTFGPDMVRALRRATKLPLDVHLMIERADEYIGPFSDAGADNIIVHIEAAAKHDVGRTLALIKGRGKSPGLSLNPATPADQALPYLAAVDQLLCMTVNPGFGGQSFMAEVLPKIQRLRDEITKRGLSVNISVDGGINPETARRCVQAGANVLVAGNALFRHKSLPMPAAIQELRHHATHHN